MVKISNNLHEIVKNENNQFEIYYYTALTSIQLRSRRAKIAPLLFARKVLLDENEYGK